MEEIIILILILLSLLTIFCLYKMLDKRGLYFAIVILDLIGFVLSFKISYAFKMNINIAIIPIISTLSIIYIFIIKYGAKEIKNLLKVTLYSNISLALLLVIMNYFVPAITETVSINMQGTFEYNYKILIAYPIMMLISEFIVSKLYQLIYTLQNNIRLCISLTHIISSIIYTVLYCIAIYIKIIDIQYSLFLGISTYIIGLPIIVINIIFIGFLTKNKKVKA